MGSAEVEVILQAASLTQLLPAVDTWLGVTPGKLRSYGPSPADCPASRSPRFSTYLHRPSTHIPAVDLPESPRDWTSGTLLGQLT
jgi:hypothetical protein